MRQMLLIFGILAVGLAITSPAMADDTFTFNFQGRLSNSSGDPVPDGNYAVMFSIYADSVGGTPLWTENHPLVHTSSGYFDATLGFTEPIDGHTLFGSNTPYLQLQVGSAPPMSPRLRIGDAPHSGIARGVSGDIQTLPGSLVVPNPGSVQASVSLHTGSENMGLVVEDRPADPVNGRNFHAGVDSGEVNLGFEGPNGQDLFSVSGKPGSLGKLTWGLFNPQPEPPGYVARVAVQSDANGGSLQMNKPGPTPGDPVIEMSYGIGSQGSIKMFNPQPEPPGWGPLYSAQTSPTGVEVALAAPQATGLLLVNNHPQIKLRSDNASSKFIFQRAFTNGTAPPDSTGIYMEADSVTSEMRFFKSGYSNLKITTNASGTASRYFRNGSEYMGIEPCPWQPGGNMTMYDAAGAVTLILASNGMASIGTGNHTNILTIQQYSATDPIADAWTTYSSRRWKTNIQPLQGSLAKVMQLQGVSYDEKEGGKHNIGLIAEDVGQVVPEVVAYEDNGVDAKSIDYARLTALLIEAVKEQQKTIEQQNAKIEKLELRLDELSDR